MVKRLVAALVCLLLSFPASAAQNIRTSLAFAPGYFPCDGVNRVAGQPGQVPFFVNTTGAPMYVKQSQMWLGMSMVGKGDFWMKVNRLSDGAYLGGTNWDHYAEPTGLHQLYYTYQPDYILLEPGDGLAIEYGCLTATPYKNGEVVVYIWWTAQP